MANLKISIRKIDLLIIACSALIFLALRLINDTDIDIKIQQYFFNFETKTWLVDRDEPVKKFFFYNLPKILLGVSMVFCLVKCFLAQNRRKFLLIIIGLVLIPTIAGSIKRFTNIYCPCQLEIYDGHYPYVKILESYPQNFVQEKRGKCFPAGHAVTGFALFILFFALEKKSHKFLGFFAAIIFGWILSFYQMAKGVHFFGDSLVSMLVCFLLAALLARCFDSLVPQVKSRGF